MNKATKKEKLTILEAVDNLSSMAEMDFDEMNDEENLVSARRWLDTKDVGHTQENVKQTFNVVRNYLKHVCEGEASGETKKGVEAIMSLAKEAAGRIDTYNSLFQDSVGEHLFSESKEFRDLEEYYYNKVLKKFETAIEEEDAWLEEWGDDKSDLLDIHRLGLKDLETVKRDHEYELFYIRKEDGRPFFNRNLLRHIKLVLDFDDLIGSEYGEDPLIHISLIQDHEANYAAHEIHSAVRPKLNAFLSGFRKFKKEPLAVMTNQAVMALMLAANKENSIENNARKTCMSYFHDFQLYLRLALTSEDYPKLIEDPPKDKNHFANKVVQLLHTLCYYFFMHKLSRDKSLKFIGQLFKAEKKGSVWTDILDRQEKIYDLLMHYPNGPLFKTLDIFREQEQSHEFEPLLQGDFPSILFDFINSKHKTTVIRTPSPTRQSVIDKAYPSEEFVGMLRYLSAQTKKPKYLLFNFQDRTNWREYARALCLEELSMQAEFSDILYVASLPRDTEFYKQAGNYIKENSASGFLRNLEDQALSGTATGYFFSPSISATAIKSFVKEIIPYIHKAFFAKKSTLTRKNRLDFIELFYLLLELKIVLMVNPSIMSFTCKDWIDIGPTSTCEFYALIRILTTEKKWNESEIEEVVEMLFSPALILRERAIDSQRLNRMVSALSHFASHLHKERKKITKELEKLYPKLLIKQLKTSEL
ncbi:MAG: hypothetical protein MRY21_01350 [Simkaniaceae bacterium]|nr:hypothetical protein [Simkaniaceae bacterium]